MFFRLFNKSTLKSFTPFEWFYLTTNNWQIWVITPAPVRQVNASVTLTFQAVSFEQWWIVRINSHNSWLTGPEFTSKVLNREVVGVGQNKSAEKKIKLDENRRTRKKWNSAYCTRGTVRTSRRVCVRATITWSDYSPRTRESSYNRATTGNSLGDVNVRLTVLGLTLP